jgi:hypothetical protein
MKQKLLQQENHYVRDFVKVALQNGNQPRFEGKE